MKALSCSPPICAHLRPFRPCPPMCAHVRPCPLVFHRSRMPRPAAFVSLEPSALGPPVGGRRQRPLCRWVRLAGRPAAAVRPPPRRACGDLCALHPRRRGAPHAPRPAPSPSRPALTRDGLPSPPPAVHLRRAGAARERRRRRWGRVRGRHAVAAGGPHPAHPHRRGADVHRPSGASAPARPPALAGRVADPRSRFARSCRPTSAHWAAKWKAPARRFEVGPCS